MDKSRNYIIDRLKSKKTSIEEFNYDALQAPPLMMFFSPGDIEELRTIATSLRYSARADIRYKLIDDVCKRRGLVKFAAGTNRVVYRHPEFPDILFKIAADNVGMRDNPAEFRNQFLLKPFVAKTFEVSPCGTVAVVERCSPITSREEFISVADDVYTLLTEWVIGKYIMADIGSTFFMNFSIRRSFGVVLIDYPYLYELDGNKLFCNKSDPTSISGRCDGIIDYDDGFNYLYCTKCGAKYKARELEKKIKENELVVQRKEGIKMKVTCKGGSKAVTKVVNTGAQMESELLSTPVANVMPKDIKTVENTAPKRSAKVSMRNILNGQNSVSEIIRADAVNTVNVVKNPAKVVAPVEKVIIKEKVETVEETKPVIIEEPKVSVNGVSTEVKREGRNPFSFDESAKEEFKDSVSKKPAVEIVENAVKDIIENIDNIEIDAVKHDTLNRLFDSIVTLMGNNLDVFDLLAKTIYRVFDDFNEEEPIENYNRMVENESLKELYSRIYHDKAQVAEVSRVDNNIEILYNIITEAVEIDEEGNTSYVPITTVCCDTEDKILLQNVYNTEEVEEISESVDSEESVDDGEIAGIKLYEAKSMYMNELFPDEQPKQLLVVLDQNGEYLKEVNHLVGIHSVDNKSIDGTEFVSTAWLASIVDIAKENDEDYANASEETVSELESKEAPVGALSMNEFLAAENNTEE